MTFCAIQLLALPLRRTPSIPFGDHMDLCPYDPGLCHRNNWAFISSKVKSMTQEVSNSYQIGINVAGQFALSPLFYLSFISLYFALQLSRLYLMSTNCFDKLQWFPCASFANTVLNSLPSFNGALRVYAHVAVTSGRNLGCHFQVILFLFACIATVPLPLCHNLGFKERSQAERTRVRWPVVCAVLSHLCKQTPRPPFPGRRHIRRHAH